MSKPKKPVCGWKLSRVLWEMPGFGGKCPLPDLGATGSSLVKKIMFFFAFILQTEYTPPTTMAVSSVSCNIANT
jgi:hypothetical protein